MAKTRTDVATQIVRAIENNKVPDSVATGVTKSLFQEGDLVDYVLEEMTSGLGVRVEQAYSYAKRGKYTFGLPTGQYTKPGDELVPAVLEALRALHGTATIDIEYIHWGAANLTHIGWSRLISLHDYNPATNQIGRLTTDPSYPVYLEDMVPVIPAAEVALVEPESLENWDAPAKAKYTPQRGVINEEAAQLMTASPYVADPAATTEHLRVKTFQQTATGVVRTEFTIPATGFDDAKDYFQVKYVAGGITRYWTYESGSGGFPVLDRVYDRQYDKPGSFFPFIYFRHNKASVIQNKTTEEYRTSKRITQLIGMDYDSIAETIDANPDISDVEQAVLMFAVPASTTHPLEQRYLWEFFNNLYLAQSESQRSTSQPQAALRFASQVFTQGRLASPEIIIQDTRFKMTLKNSGIYKRTVSGSIGPVGSHSSEYLATDRHIYRRQVTKSMYEELEVADLETVFRIYEGWSVTADEDDKILIIPLDRSITRKYTMADREVLYARAMHYVFNSRVVTKLKWYQTGVFRVLMVVVAVVITVLSQGTAWESIAAAIAAGEVAAAAVTILVMILETIIVREVFKLFVKLVGVRAALIVAVVAAVVGVTQAIDAGSLSGAPFATELLAVSGNLARAATTEIAGDIGDLQAEYSAFQKEMDKATQLLETAQEMLNGTVRLNPLVIFGESPNDFYNRTVHSGNVGVIGIEAVSSFVDMKLTLPKLKDTVGIEGD